jgi:hypothetical protein
MTCLLLAGALLLAAVDDSTSTDTRETVMVMNPSVEANDIDLRDKVASAVARAAAMEERAKVFSSSDVVSLADLAAQQQLTDCDSDACLAEIGDAMGARYVLFSTIRRVGAERLVELRLFDAKGGDFIAREAAAARDSGHLLDVVVALTHDVLRVPFPPPPLYARPLVVAGAAGGVVGIVIASAFGTCAWQSDDVVRSADSTGDEKQRALQLGPWCIGGALAGGLLALVATGAGVVGAVAP